MNFEKLELEKKYKKSGLATKKSKNRKIEKLKIKIFFSFRDPKKSFFRQTFEKFYKNYFLNNLEKSDIVIILGKIRNNSKKIIEIRFCNEKVGKIKIRKNHKKYFFQI